MSPHIAPVSRIMAPFSYDWTPGWTETRSRSYGLKEAQVQVKLNKPGPGDWRNMRASEQGCLERVLEATTRTRPSGLILQFRMSFQFIEIGLNQLFLHFRWQAPGVKQTLLADTGGVDPHGHGLECGIQVRTLEFIILYRSVGLNKNITWPD